MFLGLILALVFILQNDSFSPIDPPNSPYFNGTKCANSTEIQYLYTALLNHLNKSYTTRLLYRASEHGWDASDFHKYSDGIKSTVSIFKLNTGITVGAYTSLEWESRYGNYWYVDK